MTMTTNIIVPKSVQECLEILDPDERNVVWAYIETLHSKIIELGGQDFLDEQEDEEQEQEQDQDQEQDKATTTMDKDVVMDNEEVDSSLAPLFDESKTTPSEEDLEKATDYKQQAADYKSSGDLEKALECYNQAVVLAPPSALLYANRAVVLEGLGHYSLAERDCTLALSLNPDSAKALRVRGKLRHDHTNNWQGALSDLNQAQTIDYDPDVADILKELTQKRIQQEQEEAKERVEKEQAQQEALKKRKEAAAAAKAKAAAAAKESSSASRGAGTCPVGGGMPGVPPGMSGMMEELMKDEELQKDLQNPKVMAAFQDLMSSPGGPMGLMQNPIKLQQLMSDPEVGPVLQKLMGKFMGGGGIPGMGGSRTGTAGGDAAAAASGGDDIPDLGDLPDLD